MRSRWSPRRGRSTSSDWPAICGGQPPGQRAGRDAAHVVRPAQVDAGQRPGLTSEEHAAIRRLKQEYAELRRANQILNAASALFAAARFRLGRVRLPDSY